VLEPPPSAEKDRLNLPDSVSVIDQGLEGSELFLCTNGTWSGVMIRAMSRTMTLAAQADHRQSRDTPRRSGGYRRPGHLKRRALLLRRREAAARGASENRNFGGHRPPLQKT
jgi:hypothetical protein